ncbi:MULTISPECIES: beta-ketoacyl synthase N-terminal-like domain-containing protein [Micromonospora]|uniref:Ketosynthase chain-length factor n=1 Tax=Micromonospora solifontis TaxID=2487138 RepID=A0ABX9WD83_9ACTN|nr:MULTISPECIES: beta-ketoacyl synthase N-terminal-like domain-containing protein [Micromonospora]NES13055.1 ketosynthase chain-length factor [Micromonospora sp. PPF5-17B]NES38849.1 ketosynthase chain-length factor [Micromonospora solifontis]NES54980.1 ketosynthase chain-length factor [Micromonospora sp. PPF5-6]RNL92959.1 ketosynthase chain-length factor [Micromonospora solifontis]
MTVRAVVTGIGVVAPSGVGAEAHWATVLAGTRRTGPITLFDPAGYPTRVAGEVPDFDPAGHADTRQRVQTDRWTHLGFAATRLALADAGLPEVSPDPYRWAVTLASSSGGNLFGQRELQRLWGGPSRTVGAYQSIAWFYAASVGQLSIRHQFKGPSGVTVSESAGGLDSLAHAVRTIRRGTPVVIAGATECPLSPYALACQLRSGLLSDVSDPERAYRPFDADARGYVPAEGGAVFVVEELGHALARGARVYGEITGWAATHDAAPTDPDGGPDPTHYARALRLALDRAGVRGHDVDVIWPDALGVPAYDRAEAAALRAVFGARTPPVTTQKPLTGRAHQGGSALDAATALLAFHHGLLPASVGPERPAPGCELSFLRQSRRPRSRIALVGARGFDGFNSALVLRGAAPPPGCGDG